MAALTPYPLPLHLPATPRPVLITRQLPQAHRSPRVEFVGGDADFGAESEFAAVGEAGGDVVEDAGGIDAAEELFGGCVIGGDDDVGVMRAVVIDVGNGFFERADDFDGEDEIEVFGGPVFLGGGRDVC